MSFCQTKAGHTHTPRLLYAAPQSAFRIGSYFMLIARPRNELMMDDTPRYCLLATSTILGWKGKFMCGHGLVLWFIY